MSYSTSDFRQILLYLGVECLVLEGHEENAGDLPREDDRAGLDFVVELEDSLPHFALEPKDVGNRGPILVARWHLGMRLRRVSGMTYAT